jgi:predicted porin
MVSVYGCFILDTSSGADRGGYAWMIPFRSETSFEIDEKSSASARDVFLLKLNEFRKVGATVEGNSRLQQDLTIPFEKGNGSVRLRYFRSDLFSAEYITGAERNRQEEHSVRVRLPITEQYDIEATIIQSFWNRAMAGGAMSNYRIESRSGDAGFSWYPLGAVTLGATLGGGIDRDRVSALKAVFVQAAPTAAYRFSGKGRAECTYTLTRVSLGDRDSNVLIPPPMARGQKAGANHEVTVALDYRLSNRMSLLASYTGRKFGGQKFEQFARTQVRALF